MDSLEIKIKKTEKELRALYGARAKRHERKIEQNELLREIKENQYYVVNTNGRYWLVKNGSLIRRLFGDEVDLFIEQSHMFEVC